LTKWASREKRLMGLAMGADDYLTKPFDLQELMLRVQNVIARAAREYFTDLRTGFPAAFTARDRLTDARNDPSQSIIEVTLENGNPYRDSYGSAAGAKVYQDVGELLLAAVNEHGSLNDFIGYLDEDHFIVITSAPHSQLIAQHITAAFTTAVQRYYSEEDWAHGSKRNGSADNPFMRLHCRITTGDERIEVA
jgi:PleD family two-component response regulator